MPFISDMKKDLVSIGKIVSLHGLKGELKVLPYSEFPERIFDLENVKLKENDRVTVKDIEYARFHGRYWLIKFDGINSREEASHFRGREVFVDSFERHKLPPDNYYYDDLVGLEVNTQQGDFLGYIKEIIPAGGQDLLSVDSDKRNKPLLIPAAKEIVINVNLEKRFVTVDLPEGLLDL